jgi:hypothetical protein
LSRYFHNIDRNICRFAKILSYYKKKFLRDVRPKHALPVLGAISLAHYFPLIFFRLITSSGEITHPNLNISLTEYTIFDTNFGQTGFARYYPTVVSTIRILLVTVVLFLLNILNIIAFRKYASKKAQLTSRSASSKSYLDYEIRNDVFYKQNSVFHSPLK